MTQADEPLGLRRSSAADDADRAVLVRLADGELDALEDLYDRYKTMAYSIAYRITNDASLAEDVVQEAFLGVWRNATRYVEGRGSVKTWLLAIVHHRAIDAVRRRRPTSELPDTADIGGARRPHAARCLGRGVGRTRCRHRASGRQVALGRPARGDRAGLLRRTHAAGDRGSDRYTTRHREEPHATWPARDAALARGRAPHERRAHVGRGRRLRRWC